MWNNVENNEAVVFLVQNVKHDLKLSDSNKQGHCHCVLANKLC